jgi:hypothetical protein
MSEAIVWHIILLRTSIMKIHHPVALAALICASAAAAQSPQPRKEPAHQEVRGVNGVSRGMFRSGRT